jgi:hypothetical protein
MSTAAGTSRPRTRPGGAVKAAGYPMGGQTPPARVVNFDRRSHTQESRADSCHCGGRAAVSGVHRKIYIVLPNPVPIESCNAISQEAERFESSIAPQGIASPTCSPGTGSSAARQPLPGRPRRRAGP